MRRSGREGGGVPPDFDNLPHAPDWRAALIQAREAARCGARTRSGCPCQGPAMPNGRCRMHGGSSTGARTPEGLARVRTATLAHGRRSAESIALRRQMRAAFVHLRDMVRATNTEMRKTDALHRAMLRRLGR
ncbi:HGGxSTG domain-containing protein [Methylobacterium sp. J-072]|uniref:HGGxSTG domain-containing protein n=1 Tax=Methylobacterium sp. J-072 TaxID=2836651 RepID=UPI0028BE4D84|nr:HGGxSTG domain-containing protein [Methylobacterium sp. J-072]